MNAVLDVMYKESCHKRHDAQSFEINLWKQYFQDNIPNGTVHSWQTFEEMLLPAEYIQMIKCELKQKDKVCIEIGADPALSYMSDVPEECRSIIIDPLCGKYAELRNQYGLKIKNEDGIEYFRDISALSGYARTAFMSRKLTDNEFVCGRLVAGQQMPNGQVLPVLPDYRTHRGSLSIRPWNKISTHKSLRFREENLSFIIS